MGMMKIDRLKEIVTAIDALVKKEVLVGIPDGSPDRKDNEPISNAAIGYIQETGSPVNNIPARPFLVPGVADVQRQVADRLGAGAGAALDGDLEAAERQMGAAGMIASSSAKHKINSNIQPELKESTLEARRRRGVTRENTLVDTGSLRNAITYVIRKK